MRFEPSESALIALVASLASSVVWHVWARVALDLSGVEVPLLARGAPGLLAMVIANRGRVKLGTVLSILGAFTLIACAVSALNLFAMRWF